MLHTGGGWGDPPPPPPHVIVKRFGCAAIHNKALYKYIIHSFIHSKKKNPNCKQNITEQYSLCIWKQKTASIKTGTWRKITFICIQPKKNS